MLYAMKSIASPTVFSSVMFSVMGVGTFRVKGCHLAVISRRTSADCAHCAKPRHHFGAGVLSDQVSLAQNSGCVSAVTGGPSVMLAASRS